jgi:branched-chain amino acid transport system ATP-binding protein
MLEVRQLRAGYGRIPIIQAVDLDLQDGEAVGILGHNGMGKTTLVKSLMGIIRPSGGSISFKGQDITRAPPYERARHGIGYVPQGREIFPGLSVADNLRLGARGKNFRSSAVFDRVIEEFPTLKLLLDRLGGSLSGGEQQILAIARCLCGEPRLILLDEPTEGIQPSIIDQITDMLAGLVRKRGIALVLVEQNLSFISSLCERVYVLQKGTIVRKLSHDQMADRELVSEFVGIGS